VVDGIARLFKKVIDYRGGRLPKDIGDDRIQCNITDGKGILKPVLFAALAGSQFIPVSCKFPEDTDWFARYIASRYKPKSEQISNPFGIFGIVLIPLDSLYPLGVGDGDIDFVFQKVEYRHPIFSRGFHADVQTGIVQQPFLEFKYGLVKSGKPFLVIGRLDCGSGFDDGGNEK